MTANSRTARRTFRAARRRLMRDPAVPLTFALGLPAGLAAAVVGRIDLVGIVLAISLMAAAAQAVLPLAYRTVSRRVRGSRQHIVVVRLLVAIFLAAVLMELVIPASFGLYIPVVGLAAALGLREGLVVGLIAVGLYLVPVALRPGAPDPDLLARGVAGAAVCALVAAGARYFVGRLEGTSRDLRQANALERRRVRQIAGLEQVGRLLAAGPTRAALSRVMDVLVEDFDYRYVSIYLARRDNVLELGAQRGYTTTIDTFDGTYGVVGRVMRERRAQLIPDISVDPDYRAANPDVVSEICSPLVVGEDFLGIVNVESAGRALDEIDFRLVNAVADQVAAYLALGHDRERLAELSIRDPLTGLHNRRYLDDSVRQLFAARARQETDRRQPLAAILFDLDHFGKLNKLHGLAVGDEVLRKFGQLLAEQFREADLVARYGGEEFLVILVGATLLDSERRANDVRRAFADQRHGASAGTSVTVSAGCSMIPPENNGGAAEVLAGADVALRVAKRAGRNRVVAADL